MDDNNSYQVNAGVREDAKRLLITVIIVVIAIVLLAWAELKTNFIVKAFPHGIEDSNPVVKTSPSPTPTP